MVPSAFDERTHSSPQPYLKPAKPCRSSTSPEKEKPSSTTLPPIMADHAGSFRRPPRKEMEHRSDPLPKEITPAAMTTRAYAPPTSSEFRDVSTDEQHRERM
ncbi:hypothetical protein KSP39_PZI021750 [Platanthera zijinensis]|uniref:Uncharacterized protein n=1 Tax=Platanthera zijinensis TaxID=2320716 RepID=A0AAP0AYV8_9ASPA